MNVYENLDLKNLSGEIWKPIREYPDYQISNFGRVKSFKRYHGTNERILKQNKDTREYLFVNLCKNKKGKYKLVHRLVYESFIGKLEEGYDAHHINEDKENNIPENLESKPHSKHTGDHHKGKTVSEETKIKIGKNNYQKLSNQKIVNIENDIKIGNLTQKQIAIKHGVCTKTISRIKNKVVDLYE